MNCNHVPTKDITRFEDARYGFQRLGNYESGYNYEPIICALCNQKIKANKQLTVWELQEEIKND